jgi:hypothetical protein
MRPGAAAADGCSCGPVAADGARGINGIHAPGQLGAHDSFGDIAIVPSGGAHPTAHFRIRPGSTRNRPPAEAAPSARDPAQTRSGGRGPSAEACSATRTPMHGYSLRPITSGFLPRLVIPAWSDFPSHARCWAPCVGRRLNSIKLNGETSVWGHPQGGGHAVWTALEARRYAPDVRLSGAAACAPARDLVSLAHGPETSPAGWPASWSPAKLKQRPPEVSFNHYVRQSAQAVVRRVVDRCLSEPATLLPLPALLTGEPILGRGLTTGALISARSSQEPATGIHRGLSFNSSREASAIGRRDTPASVADPHSAADTARLSRAPRPDYNATPSLRAVRE